MIYTGYFAKLKVYEEAGLQPLSIAGRAPDFYKGPQYKGLAPRFQMFNDWKKGRIDNLDYYNIFKEYLDTLDKEAVRRVLTSFDKDVILLCYEKAGDFCHRHIVADWIEDNLGMRVDEYDQERINQWKELIDTLMEGPISDSEFCRIYPTNNFKAIVDSIQNNPPEGYFLYTQNIGGELMFSLENKEEVLRFYGIET